MEVDNMYEFGVLREAETSLHNKIWAEEQRKFWETQILTISQEKEIKRLKEGVCREHSKVIGDQQEKIDRLEEGVVSLLEHNKTLEKDKDRAE